MLRGEALLSLGRVEDGRRDLRQALARAPGLDRARELLAGGPR
jgi:hypothetical protein